MTAKEKDALLQILVSLLGIVSIILYAYPELPEVLVYRLKLWLAYRNSINYSRLSYMRNNKDMLYTDDMKASE